MRALGSGDLRHRVSFEKRAVVDDGYGNPVSGDWTEQFSVRAAFRPGGLSEAVVAARLEGNQVLNVYVRTSTQTRQITSEWRMIVKDRDINRVYAVTAQPDDLTTPGFIYFQAKSGVAA